MNSTLPITADPTHEQNYPAPLPLTSGRLETRDSVPFDEERWDAWVAKGRLANTAFAKKVRMLAMLGVTVGVAAGTVWIFLG
jgi:hypothetical protein